MSWWQSLYHGYGKSSGTTDGPKTSERVFFFDMCSDGMWEGRGELMKSCNFFSRTWSVVNQIQEKSSTYYLEGEPGYLQIDNASNSWQKWNPKNKKQTDPGQNRVSKVSILTFSYNDSSRAGYARGEGWAVDKLLRLISVWNKLNHKTVFQVSDLIAGKWNLAR